MGLLKELWDFMKVRKKFWLAPIVLVLMVLSGAVVLASSHPIIATLIYPLF